MLEQVDWQGYERRQWYRYHHLFADFLRTELEKGAACDSYDNYKENCIIYL